MMFMDKYREFLVLYEQLLEMEKRMPERTFQAEANVLLCDYVNKYPGSSPWYVAAMQLFKQKSDRKEVG